MNSLPWFKFYPEKFMHGVRGLTAQDVGVYTMILCRIYEESGPIEFHTARLSTYCNMRESSFKKAVQRLVDLDKIQLNDGMISNRRADIEISSRADNVKFASRAGKISAEKRQQNQQQTPTDAQRTCNNKDIDKDIEEDKKESKKETRASALDGFEEFWDVYAFKKARPKCEAIWKRKRLNLIAEKVIAGARTYAATRSTDPGFWKYPEGWLTAERWNDEVPAPKRDVFMDWINSKGNDDADERSNNSNRIDAEIIPRLGKAH